MKSEEDEALKAHREANPERTASGRVQRASAQVANFHLAEIANNELPKDWPKRKFQSDLVPDDKKARAECLQCICGVGGYMRVCFFIVNYSNRGRWC